MASPLEEQFVRDNLRGTSVFEFGCAPGEFVKSIRDSYDVTAVDLYPVEAQGFRFIQGDLLDLQITDKFDNVIAVSSYEHCGIESADYWEGGVPNLSAHEQVAPRLRELVAVNGRLIITVPFGNNGLFFISGRGFSGTQEEVADPVWGFRTLNVPALEALFPPLTVVKKTIYARRPEFGTYHTTTGWVQVEDYLGEEYDNNNRAILCAVLEAS